MKLERLRRIGTHFESILDHSREELAGLHRESVPNTSQASQELEEAARANEEEYRSIVESHVQGLKAAQAVFDFASAAMDLNARPERAFSHMTVLRSASEASAIVLWYLDPSIGRQERQSRAMTGVRDAVGAARRFGQKARINFNDDQAAALETLEVAIDGHPSQVQGMPQLQQMLRGISRTLALEDRLSDAGLEAFSNCTHANKNARDEIVHNWDEDGQPLLTTHLAAEWGLWYASNLLMAAVWTTIQYFGRDGRDWVEGVMPHAEAIQVAFNERRAEAMSGEPSEDSE